MPVPAPPLRTPPRGRLAAFLDPKHPATQGLREHGWAIVRVCSEEQAEVLADGIWSDLEELDTGIRRDDSETWTNDRWPQTTHGLLQNQGAGLWLGTCMARLATWPVWKELFGGRDVISSFDAVSVCRPASQERTWKAELAHQVKTGEAELLASWCHTDQAKTKSQCLHHIQGGLALTRLGVSEQRTQLVVPKTGETMQSFRDRFLAAFPPGPRIKGFDPEREEWIKHTAEERKWLIENGRILAPVLEPGEMILWDSGVPHASTPGPLVDAPARRCRMSAFVSALPIELVDTADLDVRKEMLEKGVTSGHRVTAKGSQRPYLECKFAETGRTYGKALPDFKMGRKVGGFKRAYEEGNAESTAYQMAQMCGGYGNEGKARVALGKRPRA